MQMQLQIGHIALIKPVAVHMYNRSIRIINRKNLYEIYIILKRNM